MPSRDVNQLIEPFRTSVREMLKRAQEAGIPAEITETTRTLAEQKEYVRRGVSWTLESKHLTGEAVDIHFNVNGKTSYDANLYERLYAIVKDIPYIIWPYVDLRWGLDKPHFQHDPNKKPMSCESEQREISRLQTIERELNTEIGRVTQERDSYRDALDSSRSKEKEYFDNWQSQINARKQAEAKLKNCHKNRFEGMTLWEKFQILFQ